MGQRGLFLLLCAAAATAGASAQTPIIGTVAGGGSPLDLAATAWGADGPQGVAIDASGNLYISLYHGNQVWVVNPSGVVTKVIGNGVPGYSGDGGAAGSAELNAPWGVAVDSDGNLYIADTNNNVIREVSAATGNIGTFAGNGTYGYSGDGGAATSAELKNGAGIAVDSNGNLYIADGLDNVIREVSAATGNINTIAGNGTQGYSGDGGAATSAELWSPSGVALDSNGNLYIADTFNYVIREVSAATGKIGTVAGTGTDGYSGDGGAATSAELGAPYSIAVDSHGNLYIAEPFDDRIREVSAATGKISTVAGTGSAGYSGDGEAATGAELFDPIGIVVDSSGDLYIADYENNRIREVLASTGIIGTVTGNGFCCYGGDGGAATNAELNGPWGVAVDSTGNLYIADTHNNVIRKVSAATGIVSTVAGNGTRGYSGDGHAATIAELYYPEGVAVDSSGNLYIADNRNGVIREVAAATGNIGTFAGNGSFGYSGDGGDATLAELADPQGIAVDSHGNLYIADGYSCTIREVSATTGKINTVAGNGTCGSSGDGAAATSAELSYPSDVAVDSNGNLYIADEDPCAIRMVSATTGDIGTVAGNENMCGYSGDGAAATSAELEEPYGVAVDSSGNLYIADTYNNVIREVSAATGKIGTIAGSGTYGFSGDGGAATSAELTQPYGVAVSYAGRLYLADTYNNRIRALPAPATPAITWAAPAPIAAGTALSATQLDATANVPGTFVYTPAAGTVLSTGGSQTLSVAFTPADILDYATATGTTTISVTPGTETQTIAFGSLPTQIAGNPPFTLSASASSGLMVMFVSNTISVCTVSGNMVTLASSLNASAACSITATQPGNTTYAAAEPVTVTFTVDTSFGDVSDSGPNADESATFVAAIDDMLSKGITSGCTTSPFDYCPGLDVTRGQMAVFIVRSIYGSNDFPYNPTPYFNDAVASPATLGDGSANPNYVGSFFKYIQKMKELGITAGCTATAYCPNLNVTRGQMGVFIIRARYGTSFNFDSPSTPYFTDAVASPATNPDNSANPNYVGSFFKYIQRMKEDSITSGCTATTYCPNLIVTRDQMAVFMIRGGYNQLLPASEAILTSASPATGGLGDTVDVTLTGVNTHFAQGMTTVTAGAGLTVGTVTVSSATSLTVQLMVGSGAAPGPVSLVATSPITNGTEEAVLPNGFTITSDPASGAIAYWSGNGSTVNSISTLSGTLMGNATYASATSRTQGVQDAQAFSLDGTNSYVQAASGETATVSGARTLAAWVNPNASTGLGMPILTGGSTLAASDIFGITGTTGTCSSGGQYLLYIDHGGTCYVSDLSLAPGVWSLVAMTFDGSSVVFYINGVASVTVPMAQMNSYGLASYEIGGNTLGGASSGASFNGLLSEVQIYNRALTPAEIQGLYAP